MIENTAIEFAALVGIDWADRKHDICLQVADTGEREFSVLEHGPEAIDEWAKKEQGQRSRVRSHMSREQRRAFINRVQCET